MTAEKAVAKYGVYLQESNLEQAVGELEGKVLICHCRCDEVCHGDLLLDLIRAARSKKDLTEEQTGDAEDGLPTRLPLDVEKEKGIEQECRAADEGPSTGWIGRGLARRAKTMGRDRPFHDGGGLCSPGRWPTSRRRIPVWTGRDLFITIKGMLHVYWGTVKKGKGLLDFVLHLAAGRCKESPFTQKFLDECRAVLAEGLGLEGDKMKAEEGQCFRLRAFSRLLQLAGDPDWSFPLELMGGVSIGVNQELPRTPAIYEAKVKWTLGDFDGEPETDRENYKSVTGYEEQVTLL